MKVGDIALVMGLEPEGFKPWTITVNFSRSIEHARDYARRRNSHPKTISGEVSRVVCILRVKEIKPDFIYHQTKYGK